MILFISYSGLFGGAEHQLVEVATALPGERGLACPEGALAQAAEEAGLRVFPSAARSLRVRGGLRRRAAAVANLSGHALDVRRLTRSLDPELVIAWGMRSAIACRLALRGGARGATLLFQHHDLLPG